MNTQLEQLLQECGHGQQHQARRVVPLSGQEALSKLRRLAELWGLWDTAQGMASRLQTLELPANSASASRVSDNFPPQNQSSQGKMSRARRGHDTSPPPSNHPPRHGIAQKQTQTHSANDPAPPQILPAHMEVCAQSLLHSISQHVFSPPTAPIPSLTNSKVTTAAPQAAIALDIDTACMLASAMATTRQYHARLCEHVERVVAAHASQVRPMVCRPQGLRVRVRVYP